MSYLTVLILGALLLLGGCVSSEKRKEAENASELDRICSLPSDQREEALKKWKEQSGMLAFCGREPAESQK